MTRILFGLLFLGCLFLQPGCAQLEHVERDRLNHPAMDFNANLVPAPSKYLTSMEVGTKDSSGGTCSVCAK